jgi:hypothetical protein
LLPLFTPLLAVETPLPDRSVTEDDDDHDDEDD